MDFINALPIRIGIFSRKFEVKLKLEGAIARIDHENNMIFLPYPKENLENLTLGFACQSSAEIRYGDWKKAKQYTSTQINASAFKSIHSVVEEYRSSKAFMNHFKGVKHYYDEVAKKVIECYPEPSEFTLATYIEVYVRGKLSQISAYKELLKQIESWASIYLDDDLKLQLDTLLNSVINLQNHEEGLKLTSKILKLLTDYFTEDDQPNSGDDSNDDNQPNSGDDSNDDNQPNSGDDSNDDNQSNSGDDSNDDKQSKSGDDSNDDKQSNSGDDSNDDNQSNSGDDSNDDNQSNSGDDSNDDNQSNSGDDSNDDNRTIKSQKDLLDKLLKGENDFLNSNDVIAEILSEEKNQDLEKQSSESKFSTSKLVETAPVIDGDECGEALIQSTMMETSLIRNRLNALVSAESRTQKQTLKKGRKVNGRKLSRLQVGRTDIFLKKNKSEFKPNSAITILVDCSSSIGSSMGNVQKAAYSLIDTLTSVKGVDTSGFAFGGIFTDYRLKFFNEQAKVTAGRIEMLRPNGSTPLEETLYKAIQDLYSVINKKRILLVLTDGEPNDLNRCKKLIREMQSDGVLCIAIGMGTKISEYSLKNTYGEQNYIMVKQFSELANEMIELAKRLIFTQL